jgi:hypothetical protein
MTEHEASRTLVKSPPELWAECSDAASLARHLGQFGEIRITRLEPETAVAWEGERASGTVRLEPSGWGTRVVLTARAASEDLASAGVGELEAMEEVEPVGMSVPKSAPDAVEDAQPELAVESAPELAVEVEVAVAPAPPFRMAEPEPEPEPEPTRGGFFARLFGRRAGKRAAVPAAEASTPVEPEAHVEPEPVHPEAPVEHEAPAEPEASVEPEPTVALEASVAPNPEADPEPAPDEPAAPPPAPSLDTDAALTAALDSLGQAHHRPFSRA